ncbi:MAG: LuxR C-terminal-related transcriptional regulator [Rhodospirillales bacterium]|nr:LuxR C-terminal-related transcriptional regulator [Rhodospirillales bacterium]
MSRQGLLDRLLASLHEAALDDALWPAASSLIDEACGTKGNILVTGEGGLGNDLAVHFNRCCYRGERHAAFEDEYFAAYHHRDERGPRLRRLPDSRIVSVKELYTEAEKRRSVTYNEALARSDTANCLHARLDGPNGSRIIWTAADPVDDAGWSAERVETMSRLLPHIRQFVRVRAELANAKAIGHTLMDLLEVSRCGVIQLDPHGRMVALNGRAHEILRKEEGLRSAKGCLRARIPPEDATLQRLLARALPRFGEGGASGSMLVTRSVATPTRLVVHVHPVRAERSDLLANRVAAIVLVVEPELRTVADPQLVGKALDLTPAESRVAVMLAQGSTLHEIAVATGRSSGTVRWHLKQIFSKTGIARQVELVQLVQSLSTLAGTRR